MTEQYLSDFDFDLPEELIAQFPLEQRDNCRLLHVVPEGGYEDLLFHDIKKLLRPGDLLVMNNTFVIKARLRGHKATGGAGTFQPVREEKLSEHKMHSEWYSVSPEVAAKVNETKAKGGRIVAVGTTSLRTLEAAAVAPGRIQSGARDTTLFVTPGYKFNTIDALITNFHLPKSTLVMLVSAIAGRERILDAYRHAIENKYRFFSYGDAMFLENAPQAK